MSFIKTVNVGDTGVGKTCVLVSFTENAFPEEMGPTSFDNYSSEIEHDGKNYTLGLFDTSGNEKDTMRRLAYPDAKVFIIFFSLVDRSSFERVKTKWAPEIRGSGNTSPIILVGNKSDLRGTGVDVIASEEGKKVASEIGAVAYLECSAKTLIGLGELFDRVVEAAVTGK